MYVCHCRAVTDRTIQATIAAGAQTVDDLARRCSAGSECGGCWPALAQMLAAAEPLDVDEAGRHHAA